MLRLLLLLLLLLNGVYFAYTHELLRPYGFAPAQLTEPHRVARQIRPELVRVLSTDETRAVEAAARAGPKPGECLQAGPFDDAKAVAVRDAAQAILPPGSWSLDEVVEPARWIVYMGRFQDAQALAKKRAELASLNLRFEPLTNPSLEFGLSLGGYDTEARARTELAALTQRGVRTATVVQERSEVRASRLRIAAVDAAMLPKLEELKNVLDGYPLRACK